MSAKLALCLQMLALLESDLADLRRVREELHGLGDSIEVARVERMIRRKEEVYHQARAQGLFPAPREQHE